MSIWWLSDFGRLAHEKAAVEWLDKNEPWFSLTKWSVCECRFSAIGIIVAHDISYPIQLVYPDHYPEVPPWVKPQDKEVRWSYHQYGKGGELCLELRPDNWTSQATGADMLRSAFNLLNTENPLGQGKKQVVPSAHHLHQMQEYSRNKNPVLIGEECMKRLKDGTTEAVIAVRRELDDETFPILIFDKIDRESLLHHLLSISEDGSAILPVWLVRMETPDPVPSNRSDFIALLGLELNAENNNRAAVAIIIGSEKVTVFHVMAGNADTVFEREFVIFSDQAGERSGRSAETEIKKVAIVGLGSVGSKIAEILLRSGIRHFIFVDGDVMFPENLERHILDWRDVGFRKVRAVKKRLLHIAPNASIDIITKNLDWQISARAHDSNTSKLSSYDLIINATGDAPTGMLLGAIADQSNTPLVSIEIFEGGLGVPSSDAFRVEIQYMSMLSKNMRTIALNVT